MLGGGGGISPSLTPGFLQSRSSPGEGGQQSPRPEGLGHASPSGQEGRRRGTAGKKMAAGPDGIIGDQFDTRATPHPPITSSKRGKRKHSWSGPAENHLRHPLLYSPPRPPSVKSSSYFHFISLF